MDTPKVRTGLGKSDCPGSQGGCRKRGLFKEVRAPAFYPDRGTDDGLGTERELERGTEDGTFHVHRLGDSWLWWTHAIIALFI